MVNKIVTGMYLFTFVLVILSVVGFTVFYFFQKKGIRWRIRDQEEGTGKESKIMNSEELLKFDDIVDTPHGGVIIKEPDRKFIALISTVGSEWASASLNDKVSRIRSENARVNTIDKPIQTWQYSKPVDLKKHSDKFENKYKKIVEQLLEKEEDFKQLQNRAEEITDEEFNVYYDEIKKKRKVLFSLDWQRKNLEAQIAYIKKVSDISSKPDNCICYVIEWEYDPMKFTEKLDSESIWEKASQELKNKSINFINGLARSSVHARRMTRIEIIEAFRRQMVPINANKYTIEEIIGSNAYEMVTDSDSLEEILKLKNTYDKEDEKINTILDSLEPERKKRYQKLKNVNIKYPITCETCGKRINMYLNHSQYMRVIKYLDGDGLIQEMLPDLSEEYRELILSGNCGECFKKIKDA